MRDLTIDRIPCATFRGLNLSWKSGAVGIGLHLAMQAKWPYYKNKFYVVGKTLFIVSWFVSGWAIGGENAVQDFHKEQWVRRDAERMARMQLELEQAQAANAAKAEAAVATSPAIANVHALATSIAVPAAHTIDLLEDFNL